MTNNNHTREPMKPMVEGFEYGKTHHRADDAWYADVHAEADRKLDKDVVSARRALAGFTQREFMEGVMGEEYTNLILGEDGGNDITMGDLDLNDEIRREAGQKPSMKNQNHGVDRRMSDLSPTERAAALMALNNQEKVATEAAIQSFGKSMELREEQRNARTAPTGLSEVSDAELADVISHMSDEERGTLLNLARALQK